MRAWSVPESFTHTQPLQVLDNLCPLPPVLQVGRLREPCSQEERHCGRKIQVCSGEGGGGGQAGSLCDDVSPLAAVLQAGRAAGASVEGG